MRPLLILLLATLACDADQGSPVTHVAPCRPHAHFVDPPVSDEQVKADVAHGLQTLNGSGMDSVHNFGLAIQYGVPIPPGTYTFKSELSFTLAP